MEYIADECYTLAWEDGIILATRAFQKVLI